MTIDMNALSAILNPVSAPAQEEKVNEYAVAHYVNIKVGGCLDASIRIFKHADKVKGLNATQRKVHEFLASQTSEAIEEFLKRPDSFELISVKSGDGKADADVLTALTAAFAKS